MSDIVHVRHPVPVIHVPPRARKERLDFALATTAVRLRDVTSAEMAPAGEIRQDVRVERRRSSYVTVHAHEGRLWVPLHSGRGAYMGRDELASWLAQDVRSRDYANSNAVVRFARSPLQALWDREPCRGTEISLAASRQVAWDGTEPARAALVDYLDNHVVLAGGQAYARLTPVAVREYGSGVLNFVAELEPRKAGRITQFCDFGRIGELWAWQRRHRWFEPGQSSDPPFLEGIPDDVLALSGDAELGLFANLVPDDVLANMDWVDPALLGPGLRDDLGRMRRLQGLAAIGAVPEAEVEGVALLVAAIARGMREIYPGSTRQAMSRLDELASYVAEIVLPRLRAPQAAPEGDDEQALAGLGPM